MNQPRIWHKHLACGGFLSIEPNRYGTVEVSFLEEQGVGRADFRFTGEECRAIGQFLMEVGHDRKQTPPEPNREPSA
ncbi:MAG: hypothetical protein ACJ8BC_18945 [Gemmatimonadales bacterium]